MVSAGGLTCVGPIWIDRWHLKKVHSNVKVSSESARLALRLSWIELPTATLCHSIWMSVGLGVSDKFNGIHPLLKFEEDEIFCYSFTLKSWIWTLKHYKFNLKNKKKIDEYELHYNFCHKNYYILYYIFARLIFLRRTPRWKGPFAFKGAEGFLKH